MEADDPRAKWHELDQAALKALTDQTTTPGVIYPVPTSMLPASLRAMPGVVSCFASNYTSPTILANSVTVGSELAVVRTDGDIAKAYNFVVGTSSDQRVMFFGQHSGFPEHHFASTAPVPVQSLFGHVAVKSKP